VCFTTELTKAQAIASGAISSEQHGKSTGGSGSGSGGGLKRLVAEMTSPFANHDFRWVFISRLLVQMGIYTVQEYLLYYVEYAVETPEGLSPEAAVRSHTHQSHHISKCRPLNQLARVR
jgi:hypothetical protein